MNRSSLLPLIAVALFNSFLTAQEKEDRTLLPWDQMKAIINETSGDRALHHVQELVPYPRVRPAAEFEGTFRETDVLVKFAKEYGFSDVKVESFPTQAKSWNPVRGELWLIEPEVRKLYDINDLLVSLAGNSPSGEDTAEVVNVGVGAHKEDYDGKDVKGKLVLGSAGAGQLQRQAVFERGAIGVLSYNSLRPDSYPDEVLSQSIAATAPEGKATGFGWSIAPRVAREIVSMLNAGKKVVVRSVVKAETFPGELETISATIPGDGSTDQEIVVSSHVFEGYVKQGANDDNSGAGLTLEMGRAYMRLVKDGMLPPPKRTLRFLWVAEISGTIEWLKSHESEKKRIIADLNFDMEGVRLTANGSTWVMHRTPDSTPTFLNDVGQSVMEFIANLNRERVRYRSGGYGFTFPVVSPNGSMDPFYITVEPYYGASDHAIYLANGIPALMFITWPDMGYHSSQDVPERIDPTQLKRAGVVGVGAMSILASAGDDMAMRIAAESMARGTERMGAAERKGMSYMADARDGKELHPAYKEARNTIEHQAETEKATILSVSTLFAKPEDGKKKLAVLTERIDNRAEELVNEMEAIYDLRAAQKGIKPKELPVTPEERDAARTIVERVGEGRRFGGGGGSARATLSSEELAALRKLPDNMSSEFFTLIGQKRSVLAIRDFLSAEFEPLALTDLVDYLHAQEKMGLVKLVKK